jgi:hypothetical protein
MIASSNNDGSDEYCVLRHLFNEAMDSSVGDKRWHFCGSHTDPGHEVMTEYEHGFTRDRIKCQSFDYDSGVYRKHMYTFTRSAES